MRRFTLITIIVLFVLLTVAAAFQLVAARGPRRYPGPGTSPTPTAAETPGGTASPSPISPTP